ncbi:MAG: alanine racemase [Sediminicola sp.]
MLPNNNGPYHLNDVSAVDSPALLVFPEVVKENIDNALRMVSKPATTLLRPHVKTVKCTDVITMAIQKGINRFKCSTIAEAELLGMAGARDVLLCYQLSETKAKRFLDLRNEYPNTKFSSVVDNKKSAVMLSQFFQENPINIYMDVNVGMDRTGVKMAYALDLIREINGLKGLDIQGFHVYDGHVHSPEYPKRKKQAEAIFSEMKELRKRAEIQMGKKLSLVIGGSPTFPFYAHHGQLECSPGTIFFWDAGYGRSFPELPFTPAVTILTRVVSIVDGQTLCFDLGTKATASDPPQPRVDILGLGDHRIVDQYEEHLVVSVPDSSLYEVGEPFLAIPYHICPTVNLYEELKVIEMGDAVQTWKVLARDRKIKI